MSEATCQWHQTDDEHTPDTWQADCGAMWTFTDGGPKDNDMNFCSKCGKTLSQIDNAMTNKKDPYASEAETQALLVPDARMKAERKLAKMMAERGADEQGAEAYLILSQIALELLADQPAPVQQCMDHGECFGGKCIYPAPQPAQRKPLTDWIDPNDKTQKQYLPHIGEPVLFCHGGKTYIGKHNGGSFQTEVDYANYFNTWECHWMRLPAAHNIKEQP